MQRHHYREILTQSVAVKVRLSPNENIPTGPHSQTFPSLSESWSWCCEEGWCRHPTWGPRRLVACLQPAGQHQTHPKQPLQIGLDGGLSLATSSAPRNSYSKTKLLHFFLFWPPAGQVASWLPAPIYLPCSVRLASRPPSFGISTRKFPQCSTFSSRIVGWIINRLESAAKTTYC